jgi:hypothetical protein
MHDCQRFRETWIAGSGNELPFCEDCREFCREAAAILAALDAAFEPAPRFPEEYWDDFSSRIRTRIVEENASKRLRTARTRALAAFAAVACVVLAVTWGILRVSEPVVQRADAAQTYRIEVVDDHIQGLDAHVVDYLGRSELFLRSFTKIEPSRIEDIEDARVRASRSLAGIATQKSAAGDFYPVRIVLDEYEGVLHEIKNIESSEDIADIKTRIQRNGLIANLKAYQPRVVLVSQP